jgi:uncharacterized protein
MSPVSKNAIQYRRFGRTEIEMPVFSTGGMRYQHKWQDVPLEEVPAENQKNLEDTITRAFELGINHIETARGYGSSERQLGLIVPHIPREELILQTKVGPKENGEEFLQDFEDSLKRLKLDYVDLLAIHGINNEATLDWAIRKGGSLEAARKLQRDGKVRHIGFSTHGPTDLIIKAIQYDDGQGGFDYLNLHWYFIFQANWPAIEQATKKDMGVFIISPSDKGGKLYAPSPKLVQLSSPLHPIVFNDLFCLRRPQVHTLSVGAARPSDFDLHLEASGLLDQADNLAPSIEKRWIEVLEEAVGGDFAHRFAEGLPSWKETPGEINIPVILWLLNLARAYDMVEYAKMRYNLLGNADHWFPGQSADKMDEVDLSRALHNSPFRDQIPGLLKEANQLLKAEEQKRLSENEE